MVLPALLFRSCMIISATSNAAVIAIEDIRGERQLADFDWDIVRKAGYPIFSFTNSTQDEVEFKYSVSGTENEAYGVTKFLDAVLFEADCSTTASIPAIVLSENLDQADEYAVDLNILQATIASSDYYQEINATTAAINFCVRVDYLYQADNETATVSINFHETNVSVTVDLTAGFDLTEIAVDRLEVEQEDFTADLDYPVTAYFCNAQSEQVATPILTQGDALQFCVAMDDSVSADVYVSDILTVDLDQYYNATTIIAHADPVTTSIADGISSVACSVGICNVKTQLTSKWFEKDQPLAIDMTGTALIAFGTPSRRRLLRAAFDLSPQRRRYLEGGLNLTQVTGPIEDLLGEFGLTVDLEGDANADDNRTGMIIVCVTVSLGVTALCCLWSCLCGSKKVIKKTTITKTHDTQHMQQQEHQQPPPQPYPMPMPIMYAQTPSPQTPSPQHHPPPPQLAAPPATTNIVIQAPPTTEKYPRWASEREFPAPIERTPQYHRNTTSHIYAASTPAAFPQQSWNHYPDPSYDNDEILIDASPYTTGSNTSREDPVPQEDEVIVLAFADDRQAPVNRVPKTKRHQNSKHHRRSHTSSTKSEIRTSSTKSRSRTSSTKSITKSSTIACQAVD